MTQDKELGAMLTVSQTLADLDPEARARVLRWVVDRLSVNLGFAGQADSTARGLGDGIASTDLAELVGAFAPTLDADRALVAAYWLQVVQQQRDFEAQPVNTALKDLGHGIGNITDALTALMNRRPSFVIQVQKSGASRQARKRYRLTAAGIQEVQKRLQAAAKALIAESEVA